MSSVVDGAPAPAPAALPGRVVFLLNLGHALDHLVLMVFATAVAAIARDFGLARWEDLMPWGTGALLMFGLGALPAGRLGDRWGRRPMMLVGFFGMALGCVAVACAQGPRTLAAALTLLGLFAAIYHPVGIPMLVRGARRPGATIGLNGLCGNLGIASAALLTGALVQTWGWRAGFLVPAVACALAGGLFALWVPREPEPPSRARGKPAAVVLPPGQLARTLAIVTFGSATGSLLFNVSTNGNAQLLAERLRGVLEQPAALGALLAAIYAVGALAQVVVGRLIDRHPLKRVQLAIVLMQPPLLLAAAWAPGAWVCPALLGLMVLIFGAVPFTDAALVRYVEDRIRSRVAGLRLSISLGLSGLAVWALGPLVKSLGFGPVLSLLAGVSLLTAAALSALPDEPRPAAAG